MVRGRRRIGFRALDPPGGRALLGLQAAGKGLWRLRRTLLGLRLHRWKGWRSGRVQDTGLGTAGAPPQALAPGLVGTAVYIALPRSQWRASDACTGPLELLPLGPVNLGDKKRRDSSKGSQ